MASNAWLFQFISEIFTNTTKTTVEITANKKRHHWVYKCDTRENCSEFVGEIGIDCVNSNYSFTLLQKGAMEFFCTAQSWIVL